MGFKGDRISRYGAYGIISRGGKTLFAKKKSGPYKGLWGLPGGGIEFGETPEEALRRELQEETALAAGPLELAGIATSISEYERDGKACRFHHIGIIYRVLSSTAMPHLTPEEEAIWLPPEGIKIEELTPFAKYAVSLDKN